MTLTAEEVIKISQLARIELTPEEVKQFQVELSRILDYIDQLNEIDTAGVPATAQVTGLENQMRPDQVLDELTREEMLSSAVDQAEGHIKVQKVLSKNS